MARKYWRHDQRVPISIRICGALCALMLLGSVYAHAADEPTTISIASEEYPPFTSATLKDLGIDAAIVTAAFKLEGIQTLYEFLPSARSFNMACLVNAMEKGQGKS